MQFFASSLMLAALAAAAPTPSVTTSSVVTAYTAAINPGSQFEPPPLWDPPSPPPPPLFEAPKEDLPFFPSWIVAVHQAPVQKVRVEKLSPFTGATVQPVDNIYAPSPSDEEGRFMGEGSLRPAHKSVSQCVGGFLRSWVWWISIVLLAAVLVYVAEKMFIGSVVAARKARSASRAARSRAASLMHGTRSRAASLLNEGGLSPILKDKGGWGGASGSNGSPLAKPIRSKSWDNTMV